MGKLAKKRVVFSRKFNALYTHAHLKGKKEGFTVAIGEMYRHASATHGHPGSCHRVGLAGHLLLYDSKCNWLHNVNPEEEKRIYEELHDFWEGALNGSERIANDMNHFSIEHNGVR